MDRQCFSYEKRTGVDNFTDDQSTQRKQIKNLMLLVCCTRNKGRLVRRFSCLTPNMFSVPLLRGAMGLISQPNPRQLRHCKPTSSSTHTWDVHTYMGRTVIANLANRSNNLCIKTLDTSLVSTSPQRCRSTSWISTWYDKS